MSIASMNWALRQRLSSAHQQILLYVIADSADPNGVTRHCDPGYLEEHARMTRATMFRRLGELEELGLLQRLKFYSERGAPIYEIRLDLAASVNIDIKRRKKPGEEGSDDDSDDDQDGTPESHPETLGESHAETPLPTKVSPSAAPESQYCDSISPPVSEESPPSPPPGGVLSKAEAEAGEKRDAIWARFVEGYPGIAVMDQQAARAELDGLSIDDAEWAASVLVALKDDLKKIGRPAKNAHLWLKKGMFRNFPRGTAAKPQPETVWIVEGSEQDLALRRVCNMTRALVPVVHKAPDGSRGYRWANSIGKDLMAVAEAASQSALHWPMIERGTRQWASWQERFVAWTGRPVSIPIGQEGFRAPWPWPPSVEGKLYTATGPPPGGGLTDEDADVWRTRGAGDERFRKSGAGANSFGRDYRS